MKSSSNCPAGSGQHREAWGGGGAPPESNLAMSQPQRVMRMRLSSFAGRWCSFLDGSLFQGQLGSSRCIRLSRAKRTVCSKDEQLEE